MYQEEVKQQALGDASDIIKQAYLGRQNNLDKGLVNLSITAKGEYINISIETPEQKQRIPQDIVCVLDISGSMKELAEVKNKDGVKESHGLSLLDLLKYAIKTIITNLNDNDRFALVTFSNKGKVEFDLDYMTKEKKELAIITLDELHEGGNTNLWDGLLKGLDILNKSKRNLGSHQSVLLFTDGEPNVIPPGGHIVNLKNYKQDIHRYLPTINTYAIGKKIDSNLLDQIAMEGNGQYCFIPCPGFVGTIVVNSISNILSTVATDCILKLQLKNGAKIIDIPGGLPKFDNTIIVGSLKSGQPRDIIFKIAPLTNKQQPFLDITLEYYDYTQQKLIEGKVDNEVFQEWRDPFVDWHLCRHLFSDKIKEAVDILNENKDNIQQSQKIVSDLKEKITQILLKLDQESLTLDEKTQSFEIKRLNLAKEFITKILKDVSGEATLAVGRIESFEHWGMHYLPSIIHCHLKQQCNNFMDPGIQNYGGKLYQNIRDQVEETFLTLPAPKPSHNQNRPQTAKQKKQQAQKQNQQQKQAINQNQQQQQQQQQQAQNSVPVVAQQDYSVKESAKQDNEIQQLYYNCGGGCFEGYGKVLMADNQEVLVKNLRKGDQIQSMDGSIQKIELCVRIQCQNNKMNLVMLKNGLKITPSHPIFINGNWIKPKEIAQIKEYICSEVYNFVLENGNNLIINNIPCVTLGHQLKGNKVEHEYFGTQKIIEDLKKINGYENGCVQINTQNFVRDIRTQKICGIICNS